MRLKILLVGGFLLVAIMCGVVGYVALYTFDKVGEINTELRTNIMPNTILMVELQKKTNKIYLLGMEYIVHRKYKEKAAEIKDEMNEAMDELIELADKHFEYARYISKERRQNAQQILDKAVTFNYTINGIIDFINVQVGYTEEINEQIAKMEDKIVSSAFRILADHLMEHKMEHMQELNDEYGVIIKTHISSRNNILVTTLIIIISAITLGFFISRSITRPIFELKKVAAEIGKGKLDTRIKIRSKNEIGELAVSFNQMIADLKGSIIAEKKALKSERKKAKELQKLTEELETKVAERTKKLEKNVLKLNKSQKAMLYMVEDLNAISSELKKRTIELEASNKELEAFSYSVSHDLRAPLRGVSGFSQALLRDYSAKMDEVGEHYLERIHNASKHMGKLIDGLLALAQVTRKKMKWESVNLSQLAKEMAYELQESDSGRKVEFDIVDGQKVNGDAGLLRTVLENLMGNAWKFTKGCEKVKITFGKEEKEEEKRYFIKDNGIGFDMTFVDKLFKPFQRLHTQEEFPGTGIGLANVQRVIARHGGRVWAESAGAGKGATFYFVI